MLVYAISLIIIFNSGSQCHSPVTCDGKQYPLVGLWNSSISKPSSTAFYPKLCQISHLTHREIVQCIPENRTFYFVGNSISRGYAFKLSSLANQSPDSFRDSQKEGCLKIKSPGGQNYSCLLKINGGGEIKYMWSLYFDRAPKHAFAQPIGTDFCHPPHENGLENCLLPFWSNAQANDVFLFHYALLYALFVKSYSPPIPRTHVDELLKKDVARFFDFVDTHFPGKLKIWISTPPQVSCNFCDYCNFVDAIVAEHVRLHDWRILDAHNIAKNALNMYDDDLHHNGVISETVVQHLLSFAC